MSRVREAVGSLTQMFYENWAVGGDADGFNLARGRYLFVRGTSFLTRTNTFVLLAMFVFRPFKSWAPVAVRSHRSEDIKIGHADWHFEIRTVDECFQFFLLVCREDVDERHFHRWRSWRSSFRSARTTRQLTRRSHLVERTARKLLEPKVLRTKR